MKEIVLRRHDALKLPDNKLWTNRFEVRSESSDALYVIAQNKDGRFWGCGCHGWIRHKHCKHLAALGIPGNKRPYEAILKEGR